MRATRFLATATALASAALPLAGCAADAAPPPPERPAAPATAPVAPEAARAEIAPEATRNETAPEAARTRGVSDTTQGAGVPAPGFDDWRRGFEARAIAQGLDADLVARALDRVAPNETVIERDRFQPEFARPVWAYLDTAVSDTRVATGRRLAREKAALLAEIERRHGVDRAVVVAIWGLESAFGANYGTIPVVEALATLAWEGRRRDFAEEQLIAALAILQSGDIDQERMVGSWAGAMGHTQFIPTSFRAYAVDHDGDGRRDVWAEDAADALASTANYLARFGWDRGAPTAVEVRLPGGFDYALAGAERRTADGWSAAGVVPARGGRLPGAEAVTILLPAGADGPAFAIYPNFRTILRYNNATSYALAVSLLADRIEGAAPLVAAWPRDDRALTRAETSELQRLLTARGYDTGGVDGIVGPNTRRAVRAFQRASGAVPDGYVSGRLLDALRTGG